MRQGMSETENGSVLSIQDISCVGKCSLTVASPIISACGIETCVLPSAVLSNHTGEHFSACTFRDLTDDIPGILRQWEKEGIFFDVIQSGYLGSVRQIAWVKKIMESRLTDGGLRIVDPAMGDNGKLYRGFDAEFVKRMSDLCGCADIILPNLTEACFMTGTEYCNGATSPSALCLLIEKLRERGAKTVVLKGISFPEGKLGNAIFDEKTGDVRYYFTDRIGESRHGTGDCFAAAFTGALMRGADIYEASVIATDFVVESILQTEKDPIPSYGVRFEKALPMLSNRLRNGKSSAAERGRMCERSEYVLDGAKFHDAEGFYAEAAGLLTDGTKEMGRNADAFQDMLRGGFGKHGYGAPICIKWIHMEESMRDLGVEMVLRLIKIITDEAGEHDCILEVKA